MVSELINPLGSTLEKSSTSGAHGGETMASMPSLKLSKTNYRIWSMSMEVYLDSRDLWQTVIGEKVTKKKDRMALSEIIGGILEDMLGILFAKKTAKEN